MGDLGGNFTYLSSTILPSILAVHLKQEVFTQTINNKTMTRETLEEGTRLLQEISVAEEALDHLESDNELYKITIQANTTRRERAITNKEDLCNIGAFLIGYFTSRKSDLEKEFDSL